VFFSRNVMQASFDDRSTPPRCPSTRIGIPDRNVIYRAKCTAHWAWLAMTFVSSSSAFGIGRQQDGKCGSNSKMAIHMQMSLVFFDNFMRQRETKARTFLFGGKERGE
jgi:hypothetical protein